MEDKQWNYFEKIAASKNYQFVAGVDEAGRGPLAGPVVAASCMVRAQKELVYVNDSKKLTPEQRQLIFLKLLQDPDVYLSFSIIDPEEIDKINILQASLKAMAESCQKLPTKPDIVLVDGNQPIKIDIPCVTVVKGDSRSQSIAAASIVAKHVRDALMQSWNKIYPMYGFGSHMGYGTKKHLQALRNYGPCSIHRKSYAPVKEFLI